MIFSHLRWIPTPSQIFSSNLEELRGPSFSTLGGQPPPPPFPPLAGATAYCFYFLDIWVFFLKFQYSFLVLKLPCFHDGMAIQYGIISHLNEVTHKQLKQINVNFHFASYLYFINTVITMISNFRCHFPTQTGSYRRTYFFYLHSITSVIRLLYIY